MLSPHYGSKPLDPTFFERLAGRGERRDERSKAASRGGLRSRGSPTMADGSPPPADPRIYGAVAEPLRLGTPPPKHPGYSPSQLSRRPGSKLGRKRSPAPRSPPADGVSPPRPHTSGSAVSTTSIRSWLGSEYWAVTKDYYLLEERSKLERPESPWRCEQSGPETATWEPHTNVMEHHILDVNQYPAARTVPRYGAAASAVRPPTPRVLPGFSSTPKRTVPTASRSQVRSAGAASPSPRPSPARNGRLEWHTAEPDGYFSPEHQVSTTA